MSGGTHWERLGQLGDGAFGWRVGMPGGALDGHPRGEELIAVETWERRDLWRFLR